jgi:hypothetical protein
LAVLFLTGRIKGWGLSAWLTAGFPCRFLPGYRLFTPDKTDKPQDHRHIHKKEIVGYIESLDFHISGGENPSGERNSIENDLDEQKKTVKAPVAMKNQYDVGNKTYQQAKGTNRPPKDPVGDELER